MSYGRVLRRATHRSRSAIAIAVAVLLALVAAWALAEIILYALGRPALILPAYTAWVGLLDPGALTAPWVLAAGVGFLLLGLVLIVLALAPGRLPKRSWVTDTAAFLVDDAVIASHLAHRAAILAALPEGHVAADVSRRRAHVALTPLAGAPVDVDSLRAQLQQDLDAAPWHPTLKVEVDLSKKAVVA